MKKNLPTFSVTGSLQELIEVEMILIMLGYDVPDEAWNNSIVKKQYDINYFHEITMFKRNNLCYFTWFNGYDINLINIKATDIEDIINYVTNYKKKVR